MSTEIENVKYTREDDKIHFNSIFIKDKWSDPDSSVTSLITVSTDIVDGKEIHKYLRSALIFTDWRTRLEIPFNSSVDIRGTTSSTPPKERLLGELSNLKAFVKFINKYAKAHEKATNDLIAELDNDNVTEGNVIL